MSYKNEHLLSIFFVKNTRRSVGYACVFCLDYQQNLSIFIHDINYLKWYNLLFFLSTSPNFPYIARLCASNLVRIKKK